MVWMTHLVRSFTALQHDHVLIMFRWQVAITELPTEFDFSQSFLVQFRAVDGNHGNPTPAVQDG